MQIGSVEGLNELRLLLRIYVLIKYDELILIEGSLVISNQPR